MAENTTLWGFEKGDKIKIVDNNRQYHKGKIMVVSDSHLEMETSFSGKTFHLTPAGFIQKLEK